MRTVSEDTGWSPARLPATAVRHTGKVPLLEWTWWLPWTVVLSALGVLAAWRAWRRREIGAALRRSGYALLPWAALLLGLYGLVTRVGSAFALWAGRFVFDPTAWVGVVTAVVATGLIAVGSRVGRSGRKPTAAPAIGRRPPAAEEDLGDVEAILRKHGIT